MRANHAPGPSFSELLQRLCVLGTPGLWPCSTQKLFVSLSLSLSLFSCSFSSSPPLPLPLPLSISLSLSLSVKTAAKPRSQSHTKGERQRERKKERKKQRKKERRKERKKERKRKEKDGFSCFQFVCFSSSFYFGCFWLVRPARWAKNLRHCCIAVLLSGRRCVYISACAESLITPTDFFSSIGGWNS